MADELAGRRPFLDLVTAGLPPLPDHWMGRTTPVEGAWSHLTVRVLSPFDLVVSKLKSWRPHDRSDIEATCSEHPEIRGSLASLDHSSFWEVDLWEDTMAPRRDRVLAYLDGHRAHL